LLAVAILLVIIITVWFVQSVLRSKFKSNLEILRCEAAKQLEQSTTDDQGTLSHQITDSGVSAPPPHNQFRHTVDCHDTADLKEDGIPSTTLPRLSTTENIHFSDVAGKDGQLETESEKDVSWRRSLELEEKSAEPDVVKEETMESLSDHSGDVNESEFHSDNNSVVD